MAKGKINVSVENIFPLIKKFLYSDHEIFLRELISNATDASNKLKHLSSIGEVKGEIGDLKIEVKIDKKGKKLHFVDQGIGMTSKEVTKYINEVAFSGAEEFLEKYKDQKFLIFGFTSYVYENLILKLSPKILKANFNNAVLLHGGGWKKMKDLKVSNKVFKLKLERKLNIKNIYNYYGLVEQTGSIFIECEKCGSFLTSNFSDVIVRDKHFNVVDDGEKGFIQLLSLLPTSYPGHSILTEDIGEVVYKRLYSILFQQKVLRKAVIKK